MTKEYLNVMLVAVVMYVYVTRVTSMLEMTIKNVFVSLKISSHTRITTGIQLFELTYKNHRIMLFEFKGFPERTP